MQRGADIGRPREVPLHEVYVNVGPVQASNDIVQLVVVERGCSVWVPRVGRGGG